MAINHLQRVIEVLGRTYPKAKIVLNYNNNWELLVAVILSAQCTDKKVNEVTAKLFQKYRKLQVTDYKLQVRPKNTEEQEILNFASIPISELEQDIKSTGFYRNKAKNIQAAAKMILEKFGGKLPRTMAEMLTIPGVARKTANVVLGNAYSISEGIAVDTHVHRVSQRLRFVNPEMVGPGKKPITFVKNGKKVLDYYKDASSEKIERELMRIVPKDEWFKFTYWLIDHGRAICDAKKPKCEACQLRHFCPASRV